MTVSQAAQPPSGYSSSAGVGGSGDGSGDWVSEDGSFGGIVRGDEEARSSTTVSVRKLAFFSGNVKHDNGRRPFSRSGSTMMGQKVCQEGSATSRSGDWVNRKKRQEREEGHSVEPRGLISGVVMGRVPTCQRLLCRSKLRGRVHGI